MEKTLISDEDKRMFKKYLTFSDFKEIAIETGFKQGTVYEISKQRRRVSKNNIIVYNFLKRKLYNRLSETLKDIESNIKKYK